MVILDPYGMTFDDVGVFGLAFYLDPDQHTVDQNNLGRIWGYKDFSEKGLSEKDFAEKGLSKL